MPDGNGSSAATEGIQAADSPSPSQQVSARRQSVSAAEEDADQVPPMTTPGDARLATPGDAPHAHPDSACNSPGPASPDRHRGQPDTGRSSNGQPCLVPPLLPGQRLPGGGAVPRAQWTFRDEPPEPPDSTEEQPADASLEEPVAIAELPAADHSQARAERNSVPGARQHGRRPSREPARSPSISRAHPRQAREPGRNPNVGKPDARQARDPGRSPSVNRADARQSRDPGRSPSISKTDVRQSREPGRSPNLSKAHARQPGRSPSVSKVDPSLPGGARARSVSREVRNGRRGSEALKPAAAGMGPGRPVKAVFK